MRFGFVTIRIGKNPFDHFYQHNQGFRSEGRDANSA